MPTIPHYLAAVAVLCAGFLIASRFPRLACTENSPTLSPPPADLIVPADLVTLEKVTPSPVASLVPRAVAARDTEPHDSVTTPTTAGQTSTDRMLPRIGESARASKPVIDQRETAIRQSRALPSIRKRERDRAVQRRRRGRLTTHRIADGDDLQRLAGHYLLDESRAMEIFELNRQILPSPDILPVGIEIQVYDERDLPEHAR